MKKFDRLLDRMRNTAEEPSAESLAKREVAAQLRAATHAIAGSSASADVMLSVAKELRTQFERLTVPDTANAPRTGDPAAIVPGMEDFRDRSPITGHANPMAPPGKLAGGRPARVVRGGVTFGAAFEGAPGCVHGGFVAALLDEALGMAGVFSGGPAMTAELTTRYRQHTPIATELRIEARLVSVDGRKVRTAGEIYDGDRVIAEGLGLFIAVDPSKFAHLAAARSQRADD